jgi:hypothetical protein
MCGRFKCGTLGCMRSQQARDQVTLVIGTALLLFLTLLLSAELPLTGVGAVVGDTTLWQRGIVPVTVVSGLVSAIYLYRHRRP